MPRGRESDAAGRGHRAVTAAWAAAVALILGLFLGRVLLPPGFVRAVGTPLLILGLFVVMFALADLFTAGATAVVRFLLVPTGSSTPYREAYSLADALILRGDHAGALTILEAAAADRTADPEPLVRIGRLHRDQFGDPESAVRCLRQARTGYGVGTPRALALTWEIVELLEHRLGDPLRAAPELARIVAEYPGTRAADQAREALARARTELPGR